MALKFLADRTMGRLVKWLRILGYDTVVYHGQADRIFLNEAKKENRTALTRRRDMARRNYLGQLIIILSDNVWVQLAELEDKRCIMPDEDLFFSRCTDCNETLHLIAKKDIQEKIPPYVLETNNHFKECRRCSRIYWEGTHKEHVLAMLAAHNLIHRP